MCVITNFFNDIRVKGSLVLAFWGGNAGGGRNFGTVARMPRGGGEKILLGMQGQETWEKLQNALRRTRPQKVERKIRIVF